MGVLYIFVEGEYVGEAYCPTLMGGRLSEWEARAMRKHDEEQRHLAHEQGLRLTRFWGGLERGSCVTEEM